MKETMTVHVIGAGLAGSEATWQLVSRKIPVKLHEMRPKKSDPAHHTVDSQCPASGDAVCVRLSHDEGVQPPHFLL